MNGHTMTFNQTATEDSHNMVILSYLRVSATDPGDIVVSNKTVLSFQNENYLAEDPTRRLVVRDGAALNSNGWRGRYPYTLEWNSSGNIKCPTYSTNTDWAETNRFAWHGPVELQKKLTYGEFNGIAHLMGPISGSPGIDLTAVSDANYDDKGYRMILNLWNDGNTFAGGVVGRRNNTLRLHSGTALPADGGDLVMTNGTFEVTEESGTCALPNARFAVTSGRTSTITDGKGSWKRLTKEGPGALTYDSRLCADELSVNAGSMTLMQTNSAANYAGLVYGIKECHKAVSSDPLSCFNVFDSAVCFTNSVQLSPHMAYTSAARGNDWRDVPYPVMTYHGYIWNRSDKTVTWTFATIINNWSRIFIDRDSDGNMKLLVHQGDTREVGFVTVELTPGPHEFEYRMGTNKDGISDWGGPAYSSVTNATYADNPTYNWGVRSGLMYDPLGRGSHEYTDYQKLEDPGDGSLFTWDIPGKATEICRHPVTGEESPAVTPAFAKLTVASGATLDAGGLPSMAPAVLNGLPTIDNCGELIVTGAWNIAASDILAERKMTLTGKFTLTDTAVITLASDLSSRLSTSVPSVIAMASGGITADLSKVTVSAPYACTLSLSGDGKSLLIKRDRRGFMLICR